MKLSTIHQKVFIHFRRRRMKMFYARFAPSATTRVLDIGGTITTWTTESRYDAGFPVTLMNLRLHGLQSEGRYKVMEGDATELPLADSSFDIAFSNSVIEHMTTWENQIAFAREARRVARGLWIQTPARSFPLEPHLLAPYFQYLPRRWQRRLARHFTLWGLLTKPDGAAIEAMIADIRLLTYREMRELFPDCTILRERVLGMTKSYVAVRS